MSGFIKIHREMEKWGWIEKPLTFALWMHILRNACWEETKWQSEVLKPGQLVFGLDNWSKKYGISVASLRTGIKHLISTGEITRRIENKYSVITVVNWGLYQNNESAENNAIDKQPTSNQQAIDKQPTTDKEIKNIRNKEYNIPYRESYNSNSARENFSCEKIGLGWRPSGETEQRTKSQYEQCGLSEAHFEAQLAAFVSHWIGKGHERSAEAWDAAWMAWAQRDCLNPAKVTGNAYGQQYGQSRYGQQLYTAAEKAEQKRIDDEMQRERERRSKQ